MNIVTDGDSPVPATEASVRAAFDPEVGFWDLVTLDRGEWEFIQAGHWYFMGRNTDTEFWYPAFEAAAAGRPEAEDTREPDLHAVQFRDSDGLFGVRQMFSRPDLLRLFLAYLSGSEGWRAGLSWEPLAAE